MSVPISIIQCSGCAKEWSLHKFVGLYVYLLENGQTFPLDRSIGWCGCCHDLQPVEEIPDEAALFENFIAAYDNFQKYALTFKKTFLGGLELSNSEQLKTYEIYRRKLGEARAAIEWRKNRTSKPKCLICGSEDISYMDVFSGHEIHPECSGKLILKETDIRFAVHRRKRLYDPDGYFLREEES